MNYPANVWAQIKSITASELCKALKNDNWTMDEKKSAIRLYISPDNRRVTVHYHPGKTFGSNLLKNLLKDIGWTEKDLKILKLIK